MRALVVEAAAEAELAGQTAFGAACLFLLFGCGASSAPVTLAPTVEPDRDLDRDGDLILDRCDRCPDEAEPYNQFEDADGCPEALVVFGSRHAVVGTAYYVRGSADLAERATQQLSLATDQLRFAHAESVLSLGSAAPGEPDPDGLSQRRAEDVCTRLVAAGAALRCEAHGRGIREADDRRDELQRRVDILQLDARLVEHWYAPLYVFARYDRGALVQVERLEPTRPNGPARCPTESAPFE